MHGRTIAVQCYQNRERRSFRYRVLLDAPPQPAHGLQAMSWLTSGNLCGEALFAALRHSWRDYALDDIFLSNMNIAI
ncbi:hypothetical protein [Collimonas sp.]|jgi:hypothetical protein|uniref:hypothetical protein n=1 Tax=Collimonas sp. TaxID=1963772 RepID=UPI002CFC8FDD|nr:hypothetical protein [Collimonas sp.]HWW07892.1 hypothetical protein [Collimonas sp.]